MTAVNIKRKRENVTIRQDGMSRIIGRVFRAWLCVDVFVCVLCFHLRVCTMERFDYGKSQNMIHVTAERDRNNRNRKSGNYLLLTLTHREYKAND